MTLPSTIFLPPGTVPNEVFSTVKKNEMQAIIAKSFCDASNRKMTGTLFLFPNIPMNLRSTLHSKTFALSSSLDVRLLLSIFDNKLHEVFSISGLQFRFSQSIRLHTLITE